MKELIEKVRQWGLDRGIVYTGAEGQDKQALMEAQARYTLKETAELLDAYADQDIDKINDAIGDILVTLIVGASSDKEILLQLKHWTEYKLFCDPKIDNSLQFHKTFEDFVFYGFCVLRVEDKSELTYMNSILSLENILMRVNSEFNQSLSLKDCLELAYNEIKDRKGKVVNGQFIKEQL